MPYEGSPAIRYRAGCLKALGLETTVPLEEILELAVEGLRSRGGAAFWFFMAVVFGISALGTAIRARLWSGAAACAVILCLEAWLILHWRRASA